MLSKVSASGEILSTRLKKIGGKYETDKLEQRGRGFAKLYFLPNLRMSPISQSVTLH